MAADGFIAVIDRFSLSHGRIWLVGWAHLPGATVRKAELRLPSGGSLPLTRIGLASPDVAEERGHEAAKVRFDEFIDAPIAMAEAAQAALVLHFSNGETRTVRDLGPYTQDRAHALMPRFIEMLSTRGEGRFLEIGSRARSGNVYRQGLPSGWAYTGVDVLDGPNVDVVGDAHKLSQIFPDQKFDAFMAISVLEHILMPWRLVIELNRVMNVGALGLISTHQSWPMHDQPWDYWRFSDTCWAALFNVATGFEVVAAGLGEPVFLVPQRLHPASAWIEPSPAWGMSAVMFRKTRETTLEWPVDPDLIVRDKYPG